MIDLVLGGSLLLAVPIAMFAGLVSFASPCVLPLAPGYLAYVTGLAADDVQVGSRQRELAPVPQGAAGESGARPFDELRDREGAGRDREGAVRDQEGAVRDREEAGQDREDARTDQEVARTNREEPRGSRQHRSLSLSQGRTQDGEPSAVPPQPRGRVVAGAALFVLGFTAVFVSFGAFFGGAGMWLLEQQRLVTVVLGAAVIVLGLGFLGLPWLQRTMWWNAERRLPIRPRRGLWGAPLLGVVFAVGWTPCIGPTLAAVQSLAFTQAGAARGAILSAAYCIGLGVPFLLIALGLRWSVAAVAWTRRNSRTVSRAGGGLLVVVGVLLVTGIWGQVVVWLQTQLGGFTVIV